MYTFSKEERLCSKKIIDLLYQSGSSFLIYPFRVHYTLAVLPSKASIQVMIVAPKRKFKKAVDRNLIKRRLKEIYRLQKSILIAHIPENKQYALAISYIGNEIHDYHFMQQKMIKVWDKISKSITDVQVS